MLRPILFSTEMVDAIQAGRKTATRRVIRWNRHDVIKAASVRGKLLEPLAEAEPWYMNHVSPRPFEVGDVLWVRETWAFWPCVLCHAECECCEIYPDPPDQMETADGLTDGCFLYRADGDLPDGHKWRPSIHMPKQAARIFLRVTEVFPERLQESINEAGVPMWELRAEGIQIYERCTICIADCRENRDCRECTLLNWPRWEFSQLWDRTVRKDRLAADGWAADPWVWVVRFERCERPEGWPEA